MATAKTTTSRTTGTRAATTKATSKRTSKATSKATRPATTSSARTTKVTPTVTATAPSARTTDKGVGVSLGSIELGTVDVKAVVTDSAYATLGAGDAAVAATRDLPQRLEALRQIRRDEALGLVKDGRTKVQAVVQDVPGAARTLVETTCKEFDAYAARGRKVVESISTAAATKRAIAQTENARTQVKGAVTSIRKAVVQGQEALEGAVDKIGVRRTA